MRYLVLCALALLATTAAAQTNTKTAESKWRTLAPENTLYIDTDSGQVVVELASEFSPAHVKHIKQLVRSGFYNGLTFYRVIDGFVIQGGIEEKPSTNPLAKQTMKAEFERTIKPGESFTLVQSPDLLADQTGFIGGFAVGRNLKQNKEWLLTCPGVINLARSADPDSGTTDFAIMIGQAPRHLDRNMSIWGRIVHGMRNLNLIKRGDRRQGGFIENTAERSKIIKMTIGSDLPKQQQAIIRIENTDTAAFKRKIDDRRKRANDFYVDKGNGALDICYLKPAVEFTAPENLTNGKK